MMMSAYKDTRYPTLFPGAEVLAKGQWSRPEDDPGINSGFRRYEASKLCAMMLWYDDLTLLFLTRPFS